MSRSWLYILSNVFLIAMLLGCSSQKYDASIVRVSTFTADSLKYRPYKPNLKAIARDEILLYAPFCNWDNDTIILERDILANGLALNIYYAQSPSRNIFCVTRAERSIKIVRQKVFNSIEEYMTSLESLPPGMRLWAQECLEAHIDIKKWNTDAIESRIEETGGIRPIGDELQRIIVRKGEVVSVERYVYYSFAPILPQYIGDTDYSDWIIMHDVNFPEDPQENSMERHLSNRIKNPIFLDK